MDREWLRTWNPALPGEFKLLLIDSCLAQEWKEMYKRDFHIYVPEDVESRMKQRIITWIAQNHPGYYLDEFIDIKEVEGKELKLEPGLYVRILLFGINEYCDSLEE